MKNRFLLFIAMLVTVLILGACSSGDDEAKTTKDGKTIIDYWHNYGEQEAEVLEKEIKPAFEKAFPEYELQLTRMPNEGLKQQVIAAVSGNEAPDLMRMDIAWVPQFAAMGALVDVSQLDGFEDKKDELLAGPMATTFFEGGYYGLPLNTNTKIAIYNKNVLESAGYTEAPKTMEELEDAAAKAIDAGAKGGMAIVGTGQTWDYLPYFWSLGGKLTNEDYSKFEGYLNSEESVQALETIVRWNEEGLIGPSIIGEQPGIWEGIQTDQYMMIDDGPWFFSILMNEEGSANPLDYTLWSTIPEGEGGSTSVIGGEDLVIFEGDTNKEGAWEFAKWMTGEEAQTIMARGTGLIPTNAVASQDEEFLQLPFVSEYVAQLENAQPRPPLEKWSEIDELISLNVEKVIRGEMGVKEALDDAAQQADAILNN